MQQSAIVLFPNTRRLSQQECVYRLEEAVNLTQSLGLEVQHSEFFPVNQPKSGTLFGLGKVDEISEKILELESELVVVDAQLTPIQQRNLEKLLNAKVLDRTGLILEIFGARARTKEGSLQVELAALTYQKSRLVRSWTHLERQRGGLGFIGGPGESQIELDKRMINTRIRALKKELEKVKKTRGLHRKKRDSIPYDVVALVGYTNAGKSTLFNALTGAAVLEKDLLFATLDPTLRALTLPNGKKIILSDTVGFVSDLPHELVSAFHATLEEVQAAQVILHVHEISNPEWQRHAEEVNKVLAVLGISDQDPRILHVYNKMDLLPEDERLSFQKGLPDNAVMTSALNEGSLAPLKDLIEQMLAEKHISVHLLVPFEETAFLAWLHRKGQVVSQKEKEDAFELEVELAPRDFSYARKTFFSYFV